MFACVEKQTRVPTEQTQTRKGSLPMSDEMSFLKSMDQFPKIIYTCPSSVPRERKQKSFDVFAQCGQFPSSRLLTNASYPYLLFKETMGDLFAFAEITAQAIVRVGRRCVGWTQTISDGNTLGCCKKYTADDNGQ